MPILIANFLKNIVPIVDINVIKIKIKVAKCIESKNIMHKKFIKFPFENQILD